MKKKLEKVSEKEREGELEGKEEDGIYKTGGREQSLRSKTHISNKLRAWEKGMGDLRRGGLLP